MPDFSAFVDIVIPVYNTPRPYIDQCIESIDLSDARVHVTLIDDGSDETTAAYLDELAALDPSIDTFHKENGGQNSARSYALQYTKSKYYFFLDSDDWLDWDAFLQILRLAEEHDPAVLAFEYTEFEGDSVRRGKRGFSDLWAIVDASEYVIQGATLSCSLFRYDAIAHDEFCVGPIMGEDIATAIPVALRAGEVTTTKFDAYCYRRNDHSVTRKHNIRAVTDITDAVDFVRAKCSQLPGNYDLIIEWVAILHILYFASIRCIEWFGPRQDVKSAFFEYMQVHFPKWRDNPYLAKCDIAQAPSFRLLIGGKWRLYSLIRKLSRR